MIVCMMDSRIFCECSGESSAMDDKNTKIYFQFLLNLIKIH